MARRREQPAAAARSTAPPWPSQKELDAYLYRLEEAERRDHRRLGREMDLFHLQEEAVGSVFWHPKGWTLWRAIEDYMRRRLDAAGYSEVRTPQLLDRRPVGALRATADKFREDMFIAEAGRAASSRSSR